MIIICKHVLSTNMASTAYRLQVSWCDCIRLSRLVNSYFSTREGMWSSFWGIRWLWKEPVVWLWKEPVGVGECDGERGWPCGGPLTLGTAAQWQLPGLRRSVVLGDEHATCVRPDMMAGDVLWHRTDVWRLPCSVTNGTRWNSYVPRWLDLRNAAID